MKEKELEKHWENIYTNKALHEVSWYEANPQNSLRAVLEYAGGHEAHILDVGGGDSFLADRLLTLGFENISVLDISKTALERAQKRLQGQATAIHWICANAVSFDCNTVNFWHDRAAFHFITEEKDIQAYVKNAFRLMDKKGHLFLGTFSDNGPLKCSGIAVKQYNEALMEESLMPYFKPVSFKRYTHPTPFGTEQEFIFGLFKPMPKTS